MIPAFNKEEVFILLSELNKKLNLSGAVHLPELKSIVFQHEANNYVLSYNDNSHFCKLFPYEANNYVRSYNGNSGFRKLFPFALDLDDGFCDKEADEPSSLLQALNQYFNRWKNNNYLGDIFPANENVKYENTNKNSALQMGLFAQSAMQPQQPAALSAPLLK